MLKTVTTRPSLLHTSLSFMYFPVTAYLHPSGDRLAPGEAEVLIEMAEGIASRPIPYWCETLIKIAQNHYMEHRKIRPDQPLSPCEFKESFQPTEIHVWADGSWGVTVAATPYALSRLKLLAKFNADGTSFTQKVSY